MSDRTIIVDNVAEAYLALLADRGIEYLFANAGTDFAPIVEAYCKSDIRAPKPVAVPHENVAVAMAHGYYMVSQRPQAVMLHTSVGTANGLCALMNAFRAHTPILLTAGRSPLTESGLVGSRDAPIHWSQEMFDQAGMIREFVKWDFQLGYAEHLETVVDRALAIAMSDPKGPVYLTLPRETLGTRLEKFSFGAKEKHSSTSAPYPDPEALVRGARIIAAAENPLIITTYAGQSIETVGELDLIAAEFALPVTHKWMRTVCLPTNHPMNVGVDTAGHLEKADLVIVVDCDVPWIPNYESPAEGARIIHIGVDPLFSHYPIRGYRSDLAIAAVSAATLRGLRRALQDHKKSMSSGIERRRNEAAEHKKRAANKRAERLVSVKNQTPIHPAWVSHCIDAIKRDDTIIIKESPLDLTQISFQKPHTLFYEIGAGGLGWGQGAALGAKLARPDQLVICTQGDGSYLFSNPISSHSVGRMYDIPVLTIIFNNGMWGAVRQATNTMYPNGFAARANADVLVSIDGTPNLECAVMTAGGYGERVDDPEELPHSLKRALKAVEEERRHAVLNVITAPPETSFSGALIRSGAKAWIRGKRA